MNYIGLIKSGMELAKLAMMALMVYQVTNFGGIIINNLNNINDNLGSAVARVKGVGEGLASEEFKEKSEKATDAVVNVKRSFIEKWNNKD